MISLHKYVGKRFVQLVVSEVRTQSQIVEGANVELVAVLSHCPLCSGN